MSTYPWVKTYWREEAALIAVVLIFFVGIVVFSLRLPFDAKIFPLLIGAAGILLCAVIAIEEWKRRAATAPADVVSDADPAIAATWPRFATALLSAPVFGLVFWLFGFFIAALAAMLLMPILMGYSDRRRILIVGLTTVAVLAVFFPYLVGISLPNGIVGDWLIDQLRPH